MNKLYVISALTVLLAAGCASHKSSQGGSSADMENNNPEYNTGATHPATTLGTNPNEDESTNAVPNSGSETETNQVTPPPDSGGTSSGPGSSSSGSGSSIAPDNNPSSPPDNSSPNQTSPRTQDDNGGALQANPDDNSPDQDNQPPQPQENNGSSGNGPRNFHHTVLMIPI